MPELPFDFNDLVNLDPTSNRDNDRMINEAQKSDMSTHNPVNRAQAFLKGKLAAAKDHMTSTDGLIDLGLALNPVTRVVDMSAKFFGQPGIQEGFTKGTTMTGDVRGPRMPF